MATVRKKRKVSEEFVEHCKVAKWLDDRHILYTHPPNGERRGLLAGMRLKAMGVKRGVPDLLIFKRLPRNVHYGVRGVAIEMKSSKGKISVHQHEFMDRLFDEGWLVKVCFNAEVAIRFLSEECGYA